MRSGIELCGDLPARRKEPWYQPNEDEYPK
jgi:hypothetical protein